MSGRKDFLSQAAPENYVAGLGRGATGFMTRSDLGPAREGPSEEQIKEALAKRAAQLGAAPPTAYGAPEKKDDDDDDDRYQDPENEVGLFATGAYDKDDDEADRIYQEVDERMDRRRKTRRLVAPLLFSPVRKDIWFIIFFGYFWIDCRLEAFSLPTGKPAKRKSVKSTSVTTRKSNNSLST